MKKAMIGKRIVSISMAFVLALALLPITGLYASAAYTPREAAPAGDNRYYLHTSAGGLNECVLGNGSKKSALPNCVGYAWGRAYEITGKRPTLSKGNAKVWYDNTGDGYSRGSTPRLGAIMCWSDSGAGLGHVAVVEGVNQANGKIRYSESFWSTKVNYSYSDWTSPPAVGSKITYKSGVVRTFKGYIYILADQALLPVPVPVPVPAPIMPAPLPVPAPVAPLPVPAPLQTSAVLPDGVYTIKGKSAKYVIPTYMREKGNGVFIYQENQVPGYGIADDFRWEFTRLSDGSYKIVNVWRQQALDVSNASAASGARVQVWDWNDSAAQHWFVHDCGNGWFKLVAKCSGLTLDVSGNGNANGTLLQQYHDNGTDAQRFKLTLAP